MYETDALQITHRHITDKRVYLQNVGLLSINNKIVAKLLRKNRQI